MGADSGRRRLPRLRTAVPALPFPAGDGPPPERRATPVAQGERENWNGGPGRRQQGRFWRQSPEGRVFVGCHHSDPVEGTGEGKKGGDVRRRGRRPRIAQPCCGGCGSLMAGRREVARLRASCNRRMLGGRSDAVEGPSLSLRDRAPEDSGPRCRAPAAFSRPEGSGVGSKVTSTPAQRGFRWRRRVDNQR